MSPAPVRVFAACLLMVASTVSWRRGDVFTGSLDPVVAGKAGCGLLALLIAAVAAQAAGHQRHRVGTGTLWLLGTVLGASLLGALAHGTLLASGAIAVRVAVLAATVVLLLRAVPALAVVGSVVGACGSIAAVAAVTGAASLSGGRLFGGIPPLHPNGIALLAGVVVLWATWRTVLGEARWRTALVGAGFLGLVWLTGSRTGLLMLLCAVLVMAVQIRRARVGLVVGALVSVAVGALALVTTGFVQSFVARGGAGTSTLESRFIAWTAAASYAESGWQWAFGGGLSVRYIPVTGQWWNEQLLDSSWVSALVQSGIVGLAAALGWALWAVAGALRAPRAHRVLLLGLLAFILGRSLLESGLFDATPAFLLLMAVSLIGEGGTRDRLRQEAGTVAIGHPATGAPLPEGAGTPTARLGSAAPAG